MAVVDLRIPGRSGLELIEAIKRGHPATLVMTLTGERSAALVAEAFRCGASSYVTKPADADDILAALADAQARLRASEPFP